MVFAGFVWWQGRIRKEPLVPLGLFRDRNFSLGNGGIAMVSLAITAMALPFQFYAQGARGWSPTESALLMAPMAVVLMILSPFVGKLVDRVHPRNITMVGFGTARSRMGWLALVIRPTPRSGRCSCPWRCSASPMPACGRRSAPPPPATCR